MTGRERIPGGRSALVLGATGLVGGHCVELLLNDPRYVEVRVIGRRPLGRTHPKLQERVTELDRMEEQAPFFAVDHVFCCLGTTIRKAGSREAFNRVDVEYPSRAAELAASSGANAFVVVSSLGADSGSRVAYSRSKGQMEDQVRAAAGSAAWIVRPALLVGERAEPRTGELIGEAILRILKPLLVGPLRRYRAIDARDVARAMIAVANRPGGGHTIESGEIVNIAAAESSRPE